MAEPWIGPGYRETGLLLLGESAYSWEEDGLLTHPEEDHPASLVAWTRADFVKAGPFMRLLSRGLTGQYSPSGRALHHAWDRVAFTNYVAGSVGVGARVRSTPAMWQRAGQQFLDGLLPQLTPRRIVVLGRTMWGKMPETSIYVTDDVQGYTNPDGSTALCWAVNHPAGGLSWGELAQIVQFACGDALRLPAS